MQLPIWGWGVGVRPVWEGIQSTHLADWGQSRRKNPYVTQKARARAPKTIHSRMTIKAVAVHQEGTLKLLTLK